MIINSATKTRTQVARVRADYLNQLDYGGVVFNVGFHFVNWRACAFHAYARTPRGAWHVKCWPEVIAFVTVQVVVWQGISCELNAGGAAF